MNKIQNQNNLTEQDINEMLATIRARTMAKRTTEPLQAAAVARDLKTVLQKSYLDFRDKPNMVMYCALEVQLPTVLPNQPTMDVEVRCQIGTMNFISNHEEVVQIKNPGPCNGDVANTVFYLMDKVHDVLGLPPQTPNQKVIVELAGNVGLNTVSTIRWAIVDPNNTYTKRQEIGIRAFECGVVEEGKTKRVWVMNYGSPLARTGEFRVRQ